jgi:hypothetical protein
LQAGQGVLEPEAARRVIEQQQGGVVVGAAAGVCRLRFLSAGLGSRHFVEAPGVRVERAAGVNPHNERSGQAGGRGVVVCLAPGSGHVGGGLQLNAAARVVPPALGCPASA